MFKTALLYILTGLLWLWCAFAIFFYGLDQPFDWIVAACFALAVPLVLVLLPYRLYAFCVIFSLYAVIITVWVQKQPRLDKDWLQSVARLPRVVYEGEQVTVYDIRDFDYQTETEFIARYYNKRFNLNQLNEVNYILSYWDGNLAVAHTMLSFGFSNGDHLAVSLETRLAKNQPQSGLNGLFKQYEVIYILADEADIFRLRTNYRQEEMFLYPLNLKPETAKAMLLSVLDRVNILYQQPEFYNTLTHNCFTGLQSDFRKISDSNKALFDYRWFANGYSDEMIYENGKIKTNLSFAETKQRHHINQYTAAATAENYSRLIRP